jgi:hypothetical protein
VFVPRLEKTSPQCSSAPSVDVPKPSRDAWTRGVCPKTKPPPAINTDGSLKT